MSNPDPSVGLDEAKELIRLCRAGKLYEIEQWIEAGKSLDISVATKRGRHRGLLEIAVETGFHSLVELIAKLDTAQSSKDAALEDAVSARRLDLVELIVASGADIKSVSLAEVVLSWGTENDSFLPRSWGRSRGGASVRRSLCRESPDRTSHLS